MLDAILEKCEQLIDDAVGSNINLVGDDGLLHQKHFRLSPAGKALMASQGETDAMVQEILDRPPEPLAGGLRGVEFAYRTLGKRGVPGPWLYQWEHPDALPMQVRVRIADAQGAWPDLVVSLPLAASYGVAPEDAP